MCFVDADQTVSHLKHVVPQRDDDELSILGLFLSGGQKKRLKNVILKEGATDALE